MKIELNEEQRHFLVDCITKSDIRYGTKRHRVANEILKKISPPKE